MAALRARRFRGLPGERRLGSGLEGAGGMGEGTVAGPFRCAEDGSKTDKETIA